MRWGKERAITFSLICVLACGLAGPQLIHEASATESSNTKSTSTGGIRFGIDREEYDAQARAAMQVDPVVAAHIGAIRKIALDEPASLEEPGPDVLVFDVEGSRGEGRVTARFITVSATAEALGPGMLVMADGTEHAIEGDAGALAAEHEGHGHDVESGIALGEDIFTRQAREAAQRYPLVQEHIGRIERFVIDAIATGEAPGMDEFVFDIAGSVGRGQLLAEFITVDADTERLGKGVLTLADGRELPFAGEAPYPRERRADDGDGIPETFATQDGIFVLQASAAMQAHPVIQRHIGDIREARFDREVSWALPGDRYSFYLVGSKGEGRVVAEFITVDADSERLGDGELVMADGRTHALKSP
ncbi:hypothetical protein [Pseudoxanthomonas putridarboris]|uniref:Uncharacterized protein n=1 Tax=Pseudoxanthomonas putridarboris TaxID=752605 RepID=A0ABU9IVY5_9GAMM